MALDTYIRVGDFSDDEASNKGGRSTVDTAQLDAELDAIQNIIGSASDLLSIIQRDDGLLTNNILRGHEFSPESLSAIGASLSTSGWISRGSWAAGITYRPNDVVFVIESGSYVCLVEHVSPGSFVYDANWQIIAENGPAGGLSAGHVLISGGITDLNASHHFKTIETTGVVTLNMPLASTVVDGYTVTVVPKSNIAQIVRKPASGDTIDGGTSKTVTYHADGPTFITLQVNAAKTGYVTLAARTSAYASGIGLWSGGSITGQLAPVSYGVARSNAAGSAFTVDGYAVSAAKTAYYLVAETDHLDIIRCDASAGAFTVALPAAVGLVAGFRVTIIKTDASSNAILIDGYASETINGQQTLSLAIQYEYAELLFDGANWLIVDDGRKAYVGTVSLSLATTANSYATITHNLGTDDVDLGMEIYGSLPIGSGGEKVTGVIMAPDKRMFSLAPQAGTYPTLGLVPSAGTVNVFLRNNHTSTQTVTAKVWIRRRTA